MRAAISIDETKPHWAIKQGLDKVAESLGMTNVKVSGDFDTKHTLIFGDIEDFSAFAEKMKNSDLKWGTLCRVAGDE